MTLTASINPQGLKPHYCDGAPLEEEVISFIFEHTLTGCDLTTSCWIPNTVSAPSAITSCFLAITVLFHLRRGSDNQVIVTAISTNIKTLVSHNILVFSKVAHSVCILGVQSLIKTTGNLEDTLCNCLTCFPLIQVKELVDGRQWLIFRLPDVTPGQMILNAPPPCTLHLPWFMNQTTTLTWNSFSTPSSSAMIASRHQFGQCCY